MQDSVHSFLVSLFQDRPVRWVSIVSHTMACTSFRRKVSPTIVLITFMCFIWLYRNGNVAEKKYPQCPQAELLQPLGEGRRPANPSSSYMSEDWIRRQALFPHTIPWLSAKFLPRRLSRMRHEKGLRTFTALTDLLIRANVTFVMSDGTLLGSYFSHGILPWDDDFDITVKYSDIYKVRKIFRNVTVLRKFALMGFADDVDIYDVQSLKADGTVEEIADRKRNQEMTGKPPTRYYQFKFYPRNGYRIGDKTYTWPFIDVKYYEENSTHVWTRELPEEMVVWRRDTLYPLHYRPFGSVWLPSPRDTRSTLLTKYKTLGCRTHYWDHINEIFAEEQREVDCSKLQSFYPFVYRMPANGHGIIETLMVDRNVIHTVIVNEPTHISIPWNICQQA